MVSESQLKSIAKDIRRMTLLCAGFSGEGHLGGALSISDLLAVLYHNKMRVDPQNPKKPGRDRLIVSKGHAGPAVYAALASRDFFPKDWLKTLNALGTNLPSHCDMNRTPGIDMTTGSLGQGTSSAVGIAFAPEIIPIRLLTKLAQGEASTPLPPMLEMLCVTLLLEIVREAGLRAPQSISHTVSLVGALIIGETAVSAGIVSVPVLTMAAAATIATLAVPSLYEQSILFRFAVIVLAGCFGVPGLACAALTILAMACGSEPFGYDYLYPLMPPGRASVRDGFVRSIWSRLAKSGEVISRHEA